MYRYSGFMDGELFTADNPVVVLGLPERDGLMTFESKLAAWQHLEGAARQDRRARRVRVYELEGDRWMRIPAEPTYLQKLHAWRQLASSPGELSQAV